MPAAGSVRRAGVQAVAPPQGTHGELMSFSALHGPVPQHHKSHWLLGAWKSELGRGGGRYLFVFPFLYLFPALRSYAADFIYIKQLWSLKLTPRQSLIIYLKSAVTPQVHLLPKDLARHVIQGASRFRKLIKLYTLSRHLSQRY